MFINLYFKFLKKIRLIYRKNSDIDKSSVIEAGTVFINSTMDRHSYIGYDSTILNTNIGSFCSIANKVTIGGATHPMHFVSTSPVFLSHKDSVKTKLANFNYLPIIETDIGHDVWIGEGVYIKSGIKIGTGAIIGMASVVTKDVPPYAIYAGNPAKLIRYRFNDEIISGLLKTEWWNWSNDRFKCYGKYFDNPEELLKILSEEN